MTSEPLLTLAARLENAASGPFSSVLVGFDAFIDDLTHVVERRQTPDSYEPMASLADFGAWISAAAGRSGLREAVVAKSCAGGCAINLGDGLAALGFPVNACVGVGESPPSAFAPVLARFNSRIPFPCEPGRTAAYEFADGKLMLCTTSHFAAITPEFLARNLDYRAYRRLASESGAIVLTSWSVYPHMTACWRWLREEVLAGLPSRPRIFFDLADPTGRSPAELEEMAAELRAFEAIGPVTLSVNVNEATRLSAVLRLPAPGDLADTAAVLRERLGIDEVCIHTIREAATATATQRARISVPFCARPVQSVGAGDRFNSGMLAALLLDLEPGERLATACATSGFFIRNARSASLPELSGFLRRWSAAELE
jgi:sugar/nucleoside kinase (ribokinase family)